MTVQKDANGNKVGYDIDKLCCVGEYRLLVNHPNLITKSLRGEELGMLIKTKKNMLRTLYWGRLAKKTIEATTDTTITYNAKYEFNSELRSWHYPTNGKYKAEDRHCFSVTLLSLNFSNKKNLVNMTNLRDPSTLGLEYENEIFYPIGHFDSPSFQFRFYRSLLNGGEDKDGGDSVEDGEKTEKDDLEVTASSSSPHKLIREVSFEQQLLPTSSSTTPKPPPRRRSAPGAAGTNSRMNNLILGMPSLIFEGIDFTLPKLQRFGLNIKHLDIQTNVLTGLPRNSVLTGLIVGKIPPLNASKIYFIPPNDSNNQTTSSSAANNMGRQRNQYFSPPSLNQAQRISYQDYPLQNIKTFMEFYKHAPNKLQEYCPPVYRLFQPPLFYDYQLQLYRNLFATNYRKLMSHTPPELQKYFMDFWYQRVVFPIGVEPSLLYLYFLKQKDLVLNENRLKTIMFRFYRKEFPGVYQGQLPSSSSSSDENSSEEEDLIIPMQKKITFKQLVEEFVPLISINSFTAAESNAKKITDGETEETMEEGMEMDKEKETDRIETEANNNNEEDEMEVDDSNLDDSNEITKFQTSSSSNQVRLSTSPTPELFSRNSTNKTDQTMETDAGTVGTWNEKEGAEPKLGKISTDEFKFWLKYYPLYEQSVDKMIGDEKQDENDKKQEENEENLLQKQLSSDDYEKFTRLNDILRPQLDQTCNSLKLIQLIFSCEKFPKRKKSMMMKEGEEEEQEQEGEENNESNSRNDDDSYSNEEEPPRVTNKKHKTDHRSSKPTTGYPAINVASLGMGDLEKLYKENYSLMNFNRSTTITSSSNPTGQGENDQTVNEYHGTTTSSSVGGSSKSKNGLQPLQIAHNIVPKHQQQQQQLLSMLKEPPPYSDSDAEDDEEEDRNVEKDDDDDSLQSEPNSLVSIGNVLQIEGDNTELERRNLSRSDTLQDNERLNGDEDVDYSDDDPPITVLPPLSSSASSIPLPPVKDEPQIENKTVNSQKAEVVYELPRKRTRSMSQAGEAPIELESASNLVDIKMEKEHNNNNNKNLDIEGMEKKTSGRKKKPNMDTVKPETSSKNKNGDDDDAEESGNHHNSSNNNNDTSNGHTQLRSPGRPKKKKSKSN
jgi:hypothetical protein